MDTLIVWIHLLGVVSWVGAMSMHILIFVPSAMAVSPPERVKLMRTYMPMFTRYMWTMLIIVVISGCTLVGIKNGFSDLFQLNSHYSAILSLKMMFTLVMVLNAIYLSFILAPKISAAGEAPEEGGRPNREVIRLGSLAMKIAYIQLSLAITILLFAAML